MFRKDGYGAVLQRMGRGGISELSEKHRRILEDLWDWRDRTARADDESSGYVMTGVQGRGVWCCRTYLRLQFQFLLCTNCTIVSLVSDMGDFWCYTSSVARLLKRGPSGLHFERLAKSVQNEGQRG